MSDNTPVKPTEPTVAEKVRRAFESEPEFAVLANGLRERFGAKLVFVETDEFVVGKDPWNT